MDLSELEFAGTLWEWRNNGRKGPLIAYVRSDKPLRPRDRLHLADCLEGIFKRQRGRPRDSEKARQNRFLIGLVKARKAELRAQGERYRIHDKAVDHVLTAYPGVADRETLENHLRRSKRTSRKK